ncbi:MAG TPA: tRNA (adenosine(37)-N6)-dimethylallyltransferase MiaA [Candidatus Baltobacteraceae bacterium]|nr:tRNA (adenosine(37)-N6)-dimethylallyltransferase MiaA [Candidatus Baltobacteraceae bacterium]
MRTGVLVLAGPTASGKTDLAIELAKRFDAEIVSADSRQIYRGMPVGTAAPSEEQLRTVPHHLVGFLDPHERYSAARFSADATRIIEAIHARGKRAIVVGGTGFYIRALTGWVELAPEYDQAVRERLAHEARLHEPYFLYEWLTLRDPRRAAMLYPGDTYRVLRALEVALAPRESTLREEPLLSLAGAGIPFVKAFLAVDTAQLDRRIERRTDAMLAGGLLEEAERVGAGAVAANAVGYPQALAYLHGWLTLAELRTLLARATRRYARRQATWFRSEPQTQQVRADDVERLAREKLGWV